MGRVDFSSLAPCPFCGSSNLGFSASTSHGHGDCGYEHARIICKDCIATKGQHNYGSTGNDTVRLAAEAWNRRLDKTTHVTFIEEEDTEDDDLKRLYKKYGEHYSLHDWLNEVTPRRKN